MAYRRIMKCGLRWMDAGVRISKLPEFLLEWRDHSGRLSRIHPDYSLDAFLRVKARYLASWLQQHPRVIDPGRLWRKPEHQE